MGEKWLRVLHTWIKYIEMLFITVTAVKILNPLIFILLIFRFEPIQVGCFTPFVSLVTIILFCEHFFPFLHALFLPLCVFLFMFGVILSLVFLFGFLVIFFIATHWCLAAQLSPLSRHGVTVVLHSHFQFICFTDVCIQDGDICCEYDWWNGNYKTNKWKSLNCFHVIST